MKSISKKLVISVMVILLLLTQGNTVFAYQGSAPKAITVLVGVAGGTWAAIGSVVSQIFRDAGVNSSVEVGGGASNVIMIDIMDADLGMCATTDPPVARKGQAPYQEKHTEVVGVCTLFDNFVHIMVREDSGVTNVEDLEGKAFASQPVGTSTQAVFNDVLNVYGISEDDLKVTRGGQTEGAALVKDGHVIGLTATTAAPAGTLSEMAQFTSMKLLTISKEKAKELSGINDGYLETILPANTYPGQDEPVQGVRADTILITNRNMPEEEIYWITKTLVENLEMLKSAHSTMKNLTIEDMAVVGGVELHPGAHKYFEEKLGADFWVN